MSSTRMVRASGGSSFGNLPKSPHAAGGMEDAKFYELNVTLTPGEQRDFDLDATAFFIDDGPTVLGRLQFSVDDCFPWVDARYGMFVRLRRFRRLKLRSTHSADIAVHLVYTVNPDFFVAQWTV
jgi:hypothetical protein